MEVQKLYINSEYWKDDQLSQGIWARYIEYFLYYAGLPDSSWSLATGTSSSTCSSAFLFSFSLFSSFSFYFLSYCSSYVTSPIFFALCSAKGRLTASCSFGSSIFFFLLLFHSSFAAWLFCSSALLPPRHFAYFESQPHFNITPKELKKFHQFLSFTRSMNVYSLFASSAMPSQCKVVC